MSIMSRLKLTDRTRAQTLTSPEERRRSKLLQAIELQIKAAEADVKGKTFTYMVSRYTTNAETGEREKRDFPAKVRPWWFKDSSGTYYLHVKYGNRKLELAKGKHAIEVGKQDDLVPVLKQIAEAAQRGELDAATASLKK